MDVSMMDTDQRGCLLPLLPCLYTAEVIAPPYPWLPAAVELPAPTITVA